MKNRTKLKIHLSSPLFQREVERLCAQMDGFILDKEPELVLTDKPEDYSGETKAEIIDFHSFSFPLDFLSLKNTLEGVALKKAQQEGKIISIGSLIEIDRYERVFRLTPNNAETSLTEKEIAILEMLYLKQGETVSKEDMLQQIWRYHAESETHTVETHIYRLRQKLEKVLGKEELILTDNNGYKLNDVYLD